MPNRVGYRILRNVVKRNEPEFETGDYENVELSGLRRGRRGKHFELITKILNHFVKLPPGAAMKIPVKQSGLSLANLRSAIDRATKARRISIATYSDGVDLYLWNQTDLAEGVAPKRRKGKAG